VLFSTVLSDYASNNSKLATSVACRLKGMSDERQSQPTFVDVV